MTLALFRGPNPNFRTSNYKNAQLYHSIVGFCSVSHVQNSCASPYPQPFDSNSQNASTYTHAFVALGVVLCWLRSDTSIYPFTHSVINIISSIVILTCCADSKAQFFHLLPKSSPRHKSYMHGLNDYRILQCDIRNKHIYTARHKENPVNSVYTV